MEKCRGGCGFEKPLDEFGIKQDGSYYKHCILCREKREMGKRVIENPLLTNHVVDDIFLNDTKSNNIYEKKVKRENRPTMSDEKKQIVLKEQNNYCRGPGKNECNFYECDMKMNHKKFSDIKSVFPQYDHIVRWKEGGNGIENLQALCPNCHWMKTRMESLLLEDDNAEQSPNIKSIYDSLSKPKYLKNNEEYSSDSDSDLDDIFSKVMKKRK
jgi:hypothetical protein